MFSYSLCLWELLAGELPFGHLKPAAAAAEMAYHNTRPPIAVTFPKPLVAILQRGWNASAEDRPEFKEIVTILEECKQSQGAALLGNSPMSVSLVSRLSPIRDEDEGEEGRDTPPLAGHVTALRSHWEQEATRHSVVPDDALRRRLQYPQIDKNGYVSDPLSTLQIPVTIAPPAEQPPKADSPFTPPAVNNLSNGFRSQSPASSTSSNDITS